MSGCWDLHCHLLPALDDGPADAAASLALARALVADGVSTVAATPHRTQRLATPTDELAARIDEVRELLAAEDVALEVLAGSEIAVDALIDMGHDELEALRLGGTGPLLVELPMRHAPGDPAWPVREVLETGIPVLLAHVERIAMFQRDPASLRPLLEAGAWAQVNAGSLLGEFGAPAQAAAVTLLDDGLVDVIASDAHHATLRPPRIAAVRDWLAIYRPSVDADALTVHTPRVLVHPTERAA